jgi:hypothetical protein
VDLPTSAASVQAPGREFFGARYAAPERRSPDREEVGVLWLVGLAVPTLVAGVAILGYLSRRRRVAELVGQLDAARLEVARLEVSHARLEARQEAAVGEAERLRAVEHDLKGVLSSAEQEKARLDFELRQVALVASRVPLLEPKVAELAVARRDLALARERIAELVPAAAELELRNQYIETLQRELTYRDERALALEHRVDELAGQLRATQRALAEQAESAAAPSVGPATPTEGVASETSGAVASEAPATIDLVEAEQRA